MILGFILTFKLSHHQRRICPTKTKTITHGGVNLGLACGLDDVKRLGFFVHVSDVNAWGDKVVIHHQHAINQLLHTHRS